jgi:drug/metabolite transporter (DMT)-like permease
MQPLRGIALKIASVCVFVAMASLIKAADEVPPGQAVFFRSFFAIPVIVVWLCGRGELRHGLETCRTRWGICGAGWSGPRRWGWGLPRWACCRCPR